MIRRAVINVDTEWTIELDEEKVRRYWSGDLTDDQLESHIRDAIFSGDVQPRDFVDSLTREDALPGDTGVTGGNVKVEIEQFCEKHSSWMIGGVSGAYCVWCKGDPAMARAREREVAERKKANQQRSHDARG